ncbi:protein of unknown function [Amycolatopsis xylanica]|uniref:DUF1707 domain-containing protein n=1 Tax=Amycolatopsis xylanica TaxID=589385 RepID=A0A1H3M386_9PSEU|nr:DUF1707 domain-containing protein [Amycolatopsis xylanica]SDY71046.1 protein of unknown function [Amycolatopsis xylanica]
MRLSDAERQDAMDVLGEHVRTGRLDIDEFGTRSAKITQAKTVAELEPLFDDLPSPRPSVLVRGAVAEPVSAAPARWRNVGVVPIAAVLAIGVIVLTRGAGWFVVFLIPVVVLLLSPGRR